jgi:hypothetical protein
MRVQIYLMATEFDNWSTAGIEPLIMATEGSIPQRIVLCMLQNLHLGSVWYLK